ncbi:MAG: helix-turn-helix domain-containing protein [Nakamurella multipartita]
MAQATGTATGGAQTLARGLSALKAVVAAPDGLSAQDVGDLLGVHRTIAYRLLTTLVDAGLVSRGQDGRFRGAVGLLQLTAGAFHTLRAAAVPILRRLANDVGSTVSLLVVENDEAVALGRRGIRDIPVPDRVRRGQHPSVGPWRGRARAVLDPAGDTPRQRSGAQGSGRRVRDVIRRGRTGRLRARRAGTLSDPAVAACINLITYRPDLIEQARPAVMAAAAELGRALVAAPH